MEIINKLTDVGLVEVSVHGPQESYFEPTAAFCTCCFRREDEEFESDPRQ